MSTGPLVTVVAESEVMRAVLDQVARAAPTDATVLLLGETGTGKEVIAREIHARSRRAAAAFVPVNCGALQGSLLESELFGHVRGAFTGATADKEGLFAAADGGTLFLDEVGDLEPSVQVMLLRAIQERRIRRVGDARERAVDVRVIAATHRDLAAMVAKGAFREDLFYRLQVVAITLPPLRARRPDLPRLIESLLAEAGHRQGRTCTLTAAALQFLADGSWPGNVRELGHFLERMTVLAHDDRLDIDDVRELKPARAPVGDPPRSAAETQPAASTGRSPGAGRWVIRWWRFHPRPVDGGTLSYLRTPGILGQPDRAMPVPDGPEGTRVGRDVGSVSVIFDSDQISRLHATFFSESDRLAVEDNGSLNGTFVDGVELARRRRVDLRAGSVVRLGKEWLGLVLDADAGAAPAALPDAGAAGALEIKACEQLLAQAAASRTAPAHLTAAEITAALRQTGNKRKAAKLLRISPQSLYSRMRQLGITTANDSDDN